MLVTKADGDLAAAANRATSDYRGALRLMRPKYPSLPPDVLKVSALEGIGIAEAWNFMRDLHDKLKERGHLKHLREDQARRWFWNEVQAVLSEEILSNEKLGKETKKLEASVVAGKALPYTAARTLFRHIIAA